MSAIVVRIRGNARNFNRRKVYRGFVEPQDPVVSISPILL